MAQYSVRSAGIDRMTELGARLATVVRYAGHFDGRCIHPIFHLKRAHNLKMTDEVRLIMDDLSSRSDRTVAISSMALLEPVVEGLLLSKLRAIGKLNSGQKKFNKTLAGFVGWNKPIDSFGKQLTLLYLIGAIAQWAFDDLKTLSKMRNDFAHKPYL